MNITHCQFDCRISYKHLGDEKFPNGIQEETGGGAKTTKSKEYKIVIKSELTTGTYPNNHSRDYDQDSDTKESANRALMKSDNKINYLICDSSNKHKKMPFLLHEDGRTDLEGRIRNSTGMTEPILIGRWVGGDSKVGIENHAKDKINFFSTLVFEKKKKKKDLKQGCSGISLKIIHHGGDRHEGTEAPSIAVALFIQQTNF